MIIGILLLICFLLFKYLDFYTQKDEILKVPLVIGKKEAEVRNLSNEDLTFIIVDSIFDKSKPKGIIVNQNPKAYTKVKTGRSVYLTINYRNPRLIKLPNVFDKSVSYGVAQLEKSGLKIRRIDTIPDEFHVILKVSQNNTQLDENSTVSEGSAVDITVGKGSY